MKKKNINPADKSGNSLLYIEESLCIGCTLCSKACQTGAITGKFLETHSINSDKCVHCAQCLLACPTGAIKETHSSLDSVRKALSDPNIKTAAIVAPSLGADLDMENSIEASLQKKGFDRVMSAEPGADLTIVDEGCEFVKRITAKERSALITSCCPAWVRYAEIFHPEIATCFTKTKSPVMMLGSVIKDYSARKEFYENSNIFTAAILPCIAKKHEASRPENSTARGRDVDEVITARELTELISCSSNKKSKKSPTKKTGYRQLPKSGGVLSEIIRFAHRKIAGHEINEINFSPSPLGNGIMETEVLIDNIRFKAMAASGLYNAEKIIKSLKDNPDSCKLIEILACPGGCVNGGGCSVNRQTLKNKFIRVFITALYILKHSLTKSVTKTNHKI